MIPRKAFRHTTSTCIHCIFVERPTYTQIAEWRKILARLVQFLRLADMQVLEMLRRLVITSLIHLLEFMNNSACVVGEEVVS